MDNFCIIFCLSWVTAAATGTAIDTCPNQRAFTLQSSDSWTVPTSYQSVQAVSSELQCSVRCRERPAVCFGFYWQERALLCQLFNITAFFSKSQWETSVEKRNIYSVAFASPEESVLTIHGCSQCSTYETAVCNLAFDGNTDQNYYGGSCIHTTSALEHWWEAELAEPLRISAVKIYNRQDCCAERLNNFKLLVDGVECARVDRSHSFSILTVDCLGYGSRVRLVNRQAGMVISLCEVELIGSPVLLLP